MDKISTGLTWTEIKAQFDASAEFKINLDERQRRASLGKRKNGIAEERTVWRLIIQKDHKNFVRTIFRKNIKDIDGDLLSQVAGDKIVTQINNVLTTNA